MSTRSDFVAINFNQQLGDDPKAIPSFFDLQAEFWGRRSEEKTFEIFGPGHLAGGAYLIVNTLGVQLAVHQIAINGNHLPGVDIQPALANDPKANKLSFNTNMDPIPDGLLRMGLNTIQVHVSDYHPFDNFVLQEMVIHWRLDQSEFRKHIWPFAWPFGTRTSNVDQITGTGSGFER